MIVNVSSDVIVSGKKTDFGTLIKQYFDTESFKELNKAGLYALEFKSFGLDAETWLYQLSIRPKNKIMIAEYLGCDDETNPKFFKFRLHDEGSINRRDGIDFVVNSIRFASPVVKQDMNNKPIKILFIRLIADTEPILN